MKTEIITEKLKMEEIIKASKVCHVGMVDEEEKPYILPFNFGYEEGVLYLHSGRGGKKEEIFQKNPFLCISFCLEGPLHIQNVEIGCSYSMQYESVLVYGKIDSITSIEEKTKCLHLIMRQYTQHTEYSFGKPSVENVLCYRVEISQMTAKKRGNPYHSSSPIRP